METTYRRESRRVLATLIRLLGDFDLAEEALHEAFATALKHWPTEGVPDNPRAWLVSTGRFRAIDRIRRRKKLDQISEQLAHTAELHDEPLLEIDEREVADDHLRLIFTCCHPALAPEATSVFILPPSLTELERRLRGRGQDSEEVIARRMREARAEIAHYSEYDHLIVNGDFDRSLELLAAIFLERRQRRQSQVRAHATLIERLLT